MEYDDHEDEDVDQETVQWVGNIVILGLSIFVIIAVLVGIAVDHQAAKKPYALFNYRRALAH